MARSNHLAGLVPRLPSLVVEPNEPEVRVDLDPRLALDVHAAPLAEVDERVASRGHARGVLLPAVVKVHGLGRLVLV